MYSQAGGVSARSGSRGESPAVIALKQMESTNKDEFLGHLAKFAAEPPGEIFTPVAYALHKQLCAARHAR